MRRASAPAERPPTGASNAMPDWLTRSRIPESSVCAPGYDALREGLDVRADVPRAREPHALAMAGDVLERSAELADPVRAAHDERVQRDGAHERLAVGLSQHLVELVHDQVGKLVGRV